MSSFPTFVECFQLMSTVSRWTAPRYSRTSNQPRMLISSWRWVAVGPARLELDWARRWDHMQQHTAQHLLTAVTLVAELIGISPDPSRQLVILDKGTRDGVFVGLPLIDASGLMGQVVEAAKAAAAGA